MNVQFKESFIKDLRAIRDSSLRARIKEIIEAVEQARRLEDIANLKKLTGGSHYYRIRVGDYRIGLTIEGEVVTFVRFLHRRDIYKRFP
ncbi:MAG: plasmid stabilization protein [Chloroflexota bacterium]